MGDIATIGLLADAADSVANFVTVFISVYILLILAYIITSWIRLPYSPWLNRIQRFLYDVCEPYLRIFRRFVPAIGPLDLSPMIAVIVLLVVRSAGRLPALGLTQEVAWHSRPSRSATCTSAAARSATAAARSTRRSRRSSTASRTSGATAPTSPTASRSSRATSSATASSRRCSARRSSPPSGPRTS